ncbi:MAG: M56 family metallopeptidase, partial [Planctomycetaceae bacterium]|nr:M56 family metallopeptidase [Planctomycetaceae bacterium]
MPTLPSDILITLLSNALLVVPLAIAVVLICRFVKRPAVAWCLWGLVLLKFVTPAWYPLPVEDMTTLLTPAGPDEPSASIPLSEVMLTNVPLPVAEPEPEVLAEPSLLEQLAASQLQEALTAPLPMTPEFSLPDEGMSTKPIIVDTVESDEDVAVFETESPTDDITSLSGGMASRRQPGRHVVTAPDTHAHTPDGVRAWHPTFPSRSLGTREVAWAELWIELPKTLLLTSFWAAGSVVLIGVTLLRVLRFGRLVQRAEQASPAIVARVHDLAARLGCRRVPDVRVTSARVPPLLWAVSRRPVILLPSALLDQLDEEQTAALLTHELAHYVRRDHWTRWFEQGVCCLYWWHPVAWWAGHRLREAEEQCCDARVVSLTPDAARPYANALLTTIEFLNPPDHSVPALASGITPVRRSLRPFHRRLTMILEDRPSPTLTWTSRLSLLAVAVIVLPLSLVAIGDDESPATPATSVESPTDLSGSEIRESETSVSEILKSEISAPTEEAPDEEIATEDIDQPSPAGSTGETITVVRAFYPMPEELAMAFQTFIAYQTHKIEILSATADSRVIEQSGDSEGRTLSRSGLGGGFGGGVRRGRPMQSGLTLIANEDVQQHFGDFIHAVTGAASTQSENGKDTERITLVRESYDVARMDVTTHSEDFGSRKMGNILDDLLRVVKATN